MATIRLELSADCDSADRIVADAFGPGRFAKSAYRLREGVNAIDALSFVATVDGRVVGTVRYWPVDIGGVAALMLGPIAVERALQGQGIALALMQTSLDAARVQGQRIVLLVGDEPYYGRAGFKQIMPLGCVKLPGPVDPARLLGLALVDGALDGLKGEMRKARLDHPVSALGAALAPRLKGWKP